MTPFPIPSSASPSSLPPKAVVIPDERAVAAVIEELLTRSGVPPIEICRALGTSKTNLNHYRHLRRKRPSVVWLAKLAAVCGARLEVVYPPPLV